MIKYLYKHIEFLVWWFYPVEKYGKNMGPFRIIKWMEDDGRTMKNIYQNLIKTNQPENYSSSFQPVSALGSFQRPLKKNLQHGMGCWPENCGPLRTNSWICLTHNTIGVLTHDQTLVCTPGKLLHEFYTIPKPFTCESDIHHGYIFMDICSYLTNHRTRMDWMDLGPRCHNKISGPIDPFLNKQLRPQGDPVANGIPQLQQESAAEIPSLLCAHWNQFGTPAPNARHRHVA